MESRSLGFLVALAAATPGAAQCPLQWQPEGILGTTSASVNRLWDPDGAGPSPLVLVVGGSFGSVLHVPAANIASYNLGTGSWSALGSGTNGPVTALATLPTGELVVAGTFSVAGGVAASNVATWNGATWSTLGTGLQLVPGNGVRSLAVMPNGDVVAGGIFSFSGQQHSVARWDGQAWSGMLPVTIASGVAQCVHVSPAGQLYAATAAPSASVQVQAWTGSTWSPVGQNLAAVSAASPASVSVLETFPNGELVAGGTFLVGGISRSLVRLSGSTWLEVTGLPSGAVNAIVPRPNGSALVGGGFQVNQAVWSWNGSWSGGFSPIGAGLIQTCKAIGVHPDGDYFASGTMTTSSGATGSARWSGSAWTALDVSLPWPGGGVDAMLELPNGDLVVAGPHFPNGISCARKSGGVWYPMPGFTADNYDRIASLLALPNGDILAGGLVVGQPAVQRWTGTTWVSLTASWPLSSIGLTPAVLLRMPNGDVIAGGSFVDAGVPGTAGLARWDGAQWTALGGGLSSATQPICRSLTLCPNGDLLVAGSFVSAGGVAADNLARWNGSSWSAVAPGLATASVEDVLVLPGGNLIVTGQQFATVGGVTVNNIARWNGSAWSALGSGLLGYTSGPWPAGRRLALLPNGDLLVVGEFTHAGGVLSPSIARWNGAAWSSMNQGQMLSSSMGIHRVTVRTNGDVLVGGYYLGSLGGVPTNNLARLSTTCPATAFAGAAGCVGSAGPQLLQATALPWIGGTFRAFASGLPPTTFALSVFGLQSVSIPLASVLPLAAPGCTLIASPDAVVVGIATAGGFATELPIPNAPALAGLVLHHQVLGLEVDPTLTIVSLAASNSLILTVGVF